MFTEYFNKTDDVKLLDLQLGIIMFCQKEYVVYTIQILEATLELSFVTR